MATLALARGQVFTAAMRFEKLLQMNPEWAKVNDLTLFKAAIAFRRADDKKNSEETWKRLADKLEGKAGLKVGDDMIPLAKLETVVKEAAVVNVVNVHDWASCRGSNTATPPRPWAARRCSNQLWKRRPMFFDKLDGLE